MPVLMVNGACWVIEAMSGMWTYTLAQPSMAGGVQVPTTVLAVSVAGRVCANQVCPPNPTPSWWKSIFPGYMIGSVHETLQLFEALNRKPNVPWSVQVRGHEATLGTLVDRTTIDPVGGAAPYESEDGDPPAVPMARQSGGSMSVPVGTALALV